MKQKELAKASEKELTSKLEDMKKELIRLSAQRATGTTLENPKRIHVVRKTIARINTFLKNKPKEVIKKSNE